MIDIILTVNKEKVYEEVAKTTSYTGAKMDDELATIVYLRRMRIKACLNVFGARVRIPYATV
jgi:hypothetical protein